MHVAAQADADQCIRLVPGELPEPGSAVCRHWNKLEELIEMYRLERLEHQFRVAFFQARAEYWLRNFEDWNDLRKAAPRRELAKLVNKIEGIQLLLRDPQIRNSLSAEQRRYRAKIDAKSHVGMYQRAKLDAASGLFEVSQTLEGLRYFASTAIETGGRTLHDRRDDKEAVRSRINKFWREDGGALLRRRHRSPNTELSALIEAVLEMIDLKPNTMPTW